MAEKERERIDGSKVSKLPMYDAEKRSCHGLHAIRTSKAMYV